MYGSPNNSPNYYRTRANTGSSAILDRMNPVRNRVSTIASQNQQRVETYQPQSDAAFQTLSRILSMSPSNQERAGRVAARTSTVTRNYLAGRSGVAADSALTGVDSGFGAGQIANLNAARFGTLANAQNQAYDEDREMQRRNAEQLFQVLNGVTGDAQDRESAALGQAGTIDQFQYQAMAQREAEERARKEARRNGWIKALSGAAGIASSFIPGLGAGRAATRPIIGGWSAEPTFGQLA